MSRGAAPAGRTLLNRAPLKRTGRALVVAYLTALAACSGEGTAPPAPVASISVSPTTSSIAPGEVTQLTATPRDAQGNALANRAVSWSSTNESVASVSSNGLVTAVAVGGPVTIVASSEGQDGTAVITVIPPPVAAITIAPATLALTPGVVLQLTPTVRDAQGNVLTDRAVTWTSSNQSIAAVSNDGVLTGVAVGGPVTITASSEGKSGTATVTVVIPVVASIAVSPTAVAVASGGTAPLTATVRDQNDIVMTGVDLVWTSSNQAIATVSPGGMVTGVSSGGPVTITASANGQSGTASVTVTTSPCDATSAILLGQVVDGTLAGTDCLLEDGSYLDLFRIAVTANGRIQFDVTSTAFDAYLILFIENPDGSKVAVGGDDNSGGGTNARITRDVLAGETYVIGANSLLGGVTGAYQVGAQAVFAVVADAKRLGGVPDELAVRKLTMAARVVR